MAASPKRPLYLIIGGFFSAALLVLFLVLQSQKGALVDLPIRFLLFSLVPLALGFVAGGFGAVAIPAVITVTPPKELVDKLSNELKEEPPARKPSAETRVEIAEFRGTLPVIFNDWRDDRLKEYARTQGYMLAHVYRTSTQPGQRFEVFIFLARHRKGSSEPPQQDNFVEIQKAEFFFGDSWGNQVFEVPSTKGAIGVRTHAWGTFLASCRITFTKGQQPITLFRYVDFFMAPESDVTL